VHHDTFSGRWWVTSEEKELGQLPDLHILREHMDLSFKKDNLFELCESFFMIYMKADLDAQKDKKEVRRIFRNSIQTMNLFVRHHRRKGRP